MAQILKLKDASASWRQRLSELRTKPQESVIKDDNDQTVAVVLPIERYESYQTYRRQREKDFAVFDDVAEAFKDMDPDELQSRIDQAVQDQPAEEGDDDVKPSDFIVKHSNVKGGRVTRAMAYE